MEKKRRRKKIERQPSVWTTFLTKKKKCKTNRKSSETRGSAGAIRIRSRREKTEKKDRKKQNFQKGAQAEKEDCDSSL